MSESKPNWIAALRDSLIAPASERRREDRKYLKIPIDVRVASGARYPGYSRDMSRSSMGAVVSTPLAIGQQVWITFHYGIDGQEAGRTIEAQATVRQRLGFRYGFEFAAPLDM